MDLRLLFSRKRKAWTITDDSLIQLYIAGQCSQSNELAFLPVQQQVAEFFIQHMTNIR